MAAEVFLRRTHRVIAVLFLVTIPPAAYFSFTATGDEVSPVVYFPLIPLLGLALTGTSSSSRGSSDSESAESSRLPCGGVDVLTF